MSAKKVARLSVFSQHQTLPSPSQRFVSNILFDRNVLSLIEDFIVSPVHHPKWNVQLQRTYYLHKICFNSLSGDLWISIEEYITIYKTDDNELQPVKTIRCRGIVSSIHSTVNGLMVVAQRLPNIVIIYDINGHFVHQIGKETSSGASHGIAINNTLQQIAIIEWNTSSIDIYQLNGLLDRTLKTKVTDAYGLCWNEKDSLLYIPSTKDYLIHVIDVKDDKQLDTWGDGCLENFDYPCNIVYNASSQVILINDQNNERLTVFDSAGIPIKMSRRSLPVHDFVFHPDDASGHSIITSYNSRLCLEKLTDFISLLT